MSNKTQAIKELAPNCEFGWENDDYSTLWWGDDNGTAKPTEAEINAKATATGGNKTENILTRLKPAIVE